MIRHFIDMTWNISKNNGNFIEILFEYVNVKVMSTEISRANLMFFSIGKFLYLVISSSLTFKKIEGMSKKHSDLLENDSVYKSKKVFQL